MNFYCKIIISQKGKMKNLSIDNDLPMLKIVIIGESGVGKSNILSRYAYDKFYIGIHTTIGLEFITKKISVGQKQAYLQVWDTAGQEKFRALNRAFYRNALGGLLVFSLGDRKTFDSLTKWIQQVNENISDNPIFILVGNKCDLKQQQVSVEEATSLAKKQNMAYIEASAALDINITKIFELLSTKIYKIYQLKPKIHNSKMSSVLESYIQPTENKKKCCQ